MQRAALTVVVMLATVVACKARRVDEHAAKPPADAARVYTEADFASAAYKSLAEVVAAGAAAKGALAIFTVCRGEVRADNFTAYPCGVSTIGQSAFLMFSDDQRDRVRAMPTHARGACPRLLVRVQAVVPQSIDGHRAADGTWVTEESASKIVDAETLVIADVTPRAPAPAHAGVQFSTFDDIVLSKFAGGEVAELTMKAWRSQYSTYVKMITCDDASESIDFPDEKLDGELAKVADCRPIRFKLRERGAPGLAGQMLSADLVSIGAGSASAPASSPPKLRP